MGWPSEERSLNRGQAIVIGLITAVVAFFGVRWALDEFTGYSDAFKENFMSTCIVTSGGLESVCSCALDTLEDLEPNEEDITSSDMAAAIARCG